MTEYVVEWIVEVDAESPREAAKLALAIQRDPDSTATCFSVGEPGRAPNLVCLEDEEIEQ